MFNYFYKKSSTEILEEKNLHLEKEIIRLKYMIREYQNEVENKDEAIRYFKVELEKKEDILDQILFQSQNIIEKKKSIENILEFIEQLNEIVDLNTMMNKALLNSKIK